MTETATERATRLALAGYTPAVLTLCLTAQAMRNAGRSRGEVAAHLGVSMAAVKALSHVASTPPAQRLAVAEQVGLLKLLETKGAK